nr:exodeoxyribonuclease VII large subunit [Alteromonas sp. IB21]
MFNVATPLQKNQMYNWFDRYKSKEQQKVYILSSDTERKSTLKVALSKRLTVKKA